jgi:hypothetical protein
MHNILDIKVLELEHFHFKTSSISIGQIVEHDIVI